jgi:hypothetical protein
MLHSACILEVSYDKEGNAIVKICFFNEIGEEITTLRVKAELLRIENPKKGMAIWFTEKK